MVLIKLVALTSSAILNVYMCVLAQTHTHNLPPPHTHTLLTSDLGTASGSRVLSSSLHCVPFLP